MKIRKKNMKERLKTKEERNNLQRRQDPEELQHSIVFLSFQVSEMKLRFWNHLRELQW